MSRFSRFLLAALLWPALAFSQPIGETDPFTIWKDGTSTTTARIPFAQGISLNDGSESAPALNFINDTDTGIFGTTGVISFAVAGDTILTLRESGVSTEQGMLIEKYGVRIMTSNQPFTFGTDYGAPSIKGIVNTGFYITGGLSGGGGLKMYISGAVGDGFDNAGEKVYISGGLDNTLGSGWVQIGTAGVPSHWSTSVGAEDNLFVGGEFEADGTLFADGALNVVGTTTLATSLTGILKATSGVVATASSSDLITAIGDADDDATTKGVSTYVNNDFNATAGLVSINQAGTFAWTGNQSFVGAGGAYNSTVIIGDSAFATDPSPSTNVGGIEFTNANNLAAGLVMEVDEILSLGINASQLRTSYDSTRQGVIFRLDARQTFPVFSVIMQDHQDIIGGGASVEYFPLQVSEQATVTIGAAAFEGEYDTQASLYVKQGLGGGYSIKTDADIYSQGEIWIANSNPILYLVDSGGDDWKIDVLTGSFRVSNTTDGVVPLIIDPTSWRATFSNVLRANTIEAAASSAQIVFDATAGVTTTLQDSASLTSKTITLPNVTATLAHTGSGSQTFAGAVTLSSTLIVSGLATFNSTSGITLSSTSPMITFTDTTASEDDFILLTDSAGGWKIRNSTDSRDDFRISGDGKVAISTNYSPLTSTKLYVTDRITDAAAAASYAFQANLEVQTAADWSGGNLRGFAGGIVYNSPGFDFNNGSALIGLDGLVQVYIQSGDVVNNVNGVFGEASIDGATTGGTVTSLSAVGTFINIQRAAAVTTAYLFRASNVQLQTSGTVGTVYAFYDTGQTVATTNNWGFYGLTSKNYLSGDLYFGQTDGAEKIESSADNLLDLYAGTTLNFRIGSTVEASLTATVFNITGELDLDGALNHDGTTVGFFSATPVTQRTNIGVLTDSTGGSVDGTLADVTAAHDQTILNNNFADIADRINKIEQVLQDLGLTN